MFDAPVDGLVLWLGLSAISLSVAGIALSLPAGTAPDPTAVARTIDEVATSEHRVTATVRTRADAIRLRLARVSLRTEGGVGRAPLVAAEPVPAWNGSLRAILDGRRPSTVYRSEAAFGRAVRRARASAGRWRTAPDRLRVRRVTWGEVDATLVG